MSDDNLQKISETVNALARLREREIDQRLQDHAVTTVIITFTLTFWAGIVIGMCAGLGLAG